MNKRKIIIFFVTLSIILLGTTLVALAWEYRPSVFDNKIKITIKYKDGQVVTHTYPAIGKVSTSGGYTDFFNVEYKNIRAAESVTVVLPQAGEAGQSDDTCYMWWRGTYTNTAVCDDWWDFKHKNTVNITSSMQEYRHADANDVSNRTFVFTPEGLSGKQFIYFTSNLWKGSSDLPQPGEITAIIGLTFDDEPPIVSASPDSTSDWVESTDVTISVTDGVYGSGIDNSNTRLQYFISESENPTGIGTLQSYTPAGTTFKLGENKNGQYYIFVKTINDIAGNWSVNNGTYVTIGSDTYHRFGPYTFKNSTPTTVTFDLQGGKVDGSTTNPVRTMNTGTADNNTQDWMTTSRMAKTGYTFAGFYTGTNGTGTKVYDIYSGSANCAKNTDYWDDSGNWKYSGSTLTLYAYWLSNQYTMTVNYRKWNPDTNAWDIYDTKMKKVDYGTTYSPAAGTAPTGYVFDSKTADYTVAADKTFNVDFKPKQTTVTYYRNYSSADTTTASQTFTYAKTGEAFTDQSWSRAGYNILGWAVSRTATAADYSLTSPVSDGWKNAYYPSKSLYAVWQAQEYSITYDLSGGTASGNPASYNVETPTFTLNNPTRTYYRFDGWSGTGITGLSTSVTISKGSVGDRQYTAHWTDITPPTVMPSPASIQWCRNTDLTINWLDYGDGLAGNTGRNYFYFMSADGTKTSNYTYTPDAASNVGADLNGTYYLYIHEIKDKEGNVSLLGGAKTGAYHKFGPYKFDNEAPTVSVTPKAADWCTEKSVTITVNDTGGSGLSASNAYQYYLSTSNTSPTGGTWTNYTSGTAFTIGTGLNGTYYLFVKKISDNAGNVSTSSSYHMYGPYKFDNTAPTVTVSPESADWCNSVNVTITVADAGGSGLRGSNSYQYYLSTSDSSLTGGSWTNYTSGSTFTIGTGLNGTYYLYVKRVSDNAGNVSTTKGTAVTIEGTTCHRFGPHKFDNMAPEGTVTYYEDNEMLGLWDNAHEPYGLMRIGDATDNLSGIREIYLYLYDEANPDNNTTLFFTGTGRNYELQFNLYTALADNRNVTKIHMAVYGVDEAGNVGELPITNYSFGYNGNKDPVKDEDIGFKKDEDGDGYIRDNFRIEARIVNVNGHQNFVSGGKAILEIYTFGYVEAVSAEFPSIRSQMRAEYDTEVNLVKTDIEVKEYNSCNHVFYIPLYCAESLYTDNLAWGYKKGMTQKRPVYITVDGSILKTIKTILK